MQEMFSFMNRKPIGAHTHRCVCVCRRIGMKPFRLQTFIMSSSNQAFNTFHLAIDHEIHFTEQQSPGGVSQSFYSDQRYQAFGQCVVSERQVQALSAGLPVIVLSREKWFWEKCLVLSKFCGARRVFLQIFVWTFRSYKRLQFARNLEKPEDVFSMMKMGDQIRNNTITMSAAILTF